MEISRSGRVTRNRFGGILWVALIHIALFSVLLYGGQRVRIEFAKPPLQVNVLEEKKPPPPEATTKLPAVKLLQPPKAFIPPPDISVDLPSEPLATITSVTQTPPPPVPVQPLARTGNEDRVGSKTVAPVFEYTGCELLDYPDNALAKHQQGPVLLSLLIDEHGNAIESKIAKSSGNSELDEAARVGMGKCKYRPGTVDGKPATLWKKIRYNWELAY